MELWIIWFVASFVYLIGTGFAFKTIAIKAGKADRPWEDPGPFFGSILWPAYVPAMIGNKLADGTFSLANISSKRTEKRRANEIAEQEHKTALATIRAEETRQLERAIL